MTTIIGATTNYHNPLTQVDSGSLLSLNTRFMNLDAAIASLATVAAGTISVTAGQSIAENDAIYISRDDGKAYLLDNDSLTPSGFIRGFATTTASVDASVDVQLGDLLDGFTGLTALMPVYADSIAGAITQTRPVPEKSGGQVAIVQMGIAWSSTQILIKTMPIQYHLRDAMAEDDELSIVHHYDDTSAPLRQIWAYITETGSGAEATGYADGNQDVDIPLRGGATAGDSISSLTTDGSVGIGNTGVMARRGQTFSITNGGTVSEITFGLDANNGTPTGTITWEVCEDDTTEPGSIIATGTISPTESATNTITPSGLVLSPGTTYWLVLRATDTQTSGDYWQWYRSSSSVYVGGQRWVSTDGGSSWSSVSSSDQSFEVTIPAVSAKDKSAQTFTLASETTIASVGLWLKKIGSPVGTATLRVETVSSGEPTGTLADPSATITFAESVLGTSYAEELLVFASEFTLSADTYALVLSTDRTADASNYIAWGADGSSPSYAGGEMLSEASSSWSAESKDAVFSVYQPGVVNVGRISVDWWSSDHADIVNRYGDGAGSDVDEKTTFKCTRVSGFDDVTLVVEVA